MQNDLQTEDSINLNINSGAETKKGSQPPLIVFSKRFAESMIYDYCLFDKLYKIEKQKKDIERKCWFFYPNSECIFAFQEIAKVTAIQKTEYEKIAASGNVNNTELHNDKNDAECNYLYTDKVVSER